MSNTSDRGNDSIFSTQTLAPAQSVISEICNSDHTLKGQRECKIIENALHAVAFTVCAE